MKLVTRLFVFGIFGLNLFMGAQAGAAMNNTVIVKGQVADLRTKYVLLQTETGKLAVPREAFGTQELRPGQSVQVDVGLRELVHLNNQVQPNRASVK
jgi:hypothetical protein